VSKREDKEKSKEEVSPMRVVVYSDIHAPFQDDRAIELVNKFCGWYQPQRVVLIGDVIDFYAISKFDKSPRRATNEAMVEEVDTTQRILKGIRGANPKAKIQMVVGNHEFRLRKFIFKLQAEVPLLATMLDISGVGLEELLGLMLNLNGLGIELVDLDPEMAKFTDCYVTIGKIHIGHWDKVNKYAGYTAKNLIADKGVDIIQGHTHRVGSSFRRTLGGLIEAHEIGCLCGLKPQYTSEKDWQHGFAVIEGNSTMAKFTITPIAIKDYEFWFGGKHFRG